MVAKPRHAGAERGLAAQWLDQALGRRGRLGLSLGGAVGEALRPIVRRRTAVLSLVVIALTVLAAVAAPLVAPYDPTEMHARSRFAQPSLAYLLGTDEAGRDLLSRMLFGAQISITVAFAATALALLLGVPMGMVAGYARGWLDDLLMRVLDALLAIPAILLALTLVTALGPGIPQITVAIGVLGVPMTARIARASVLAEMFKEYVLAARCGGASTPYILRRVLLPNALSPLLVMGSVLAANAILLEAALSFLGFGPRPPDASWGSLLQSGYQVMDHSVWFVTFPGVAIFLLVWSFNVLGDALRDGLDPRLRNM
jgi:peptide/nickel transport system permease protein